MAMISINGCCDTGHITFLVKLLALYGKSRGPGS